MLETFTDIKQSHYNYGNVLFICSSIAMYLPTVMLNLIPKMRFVVLVVLLISVASADKKPEKVIVFLLH